MVVVVVVVVAVVSLPVAVFGNLLLEFWRVSGPAVVVSGCDSRGWLGCCGEWL